MARFQFSLRLLLVFMLLSATLAFLSQRYLEFRNSRDLKDVVAEYNQNDHFGAQFEELTETQVRNIVSDWKANKNFDEMSPGAISAVHKILRWKRMPDGVSFETLGNERDGFITAMSIPDDEIKYFFRKIECTTTPTE